MIAHARTARIGESAPAGRGQQCVCRMAPSTEEIGAMSEWLGGAFEGYRLPDAVRATLTEAFRQGRWTAMDVPSKEKLLDFDDIEIWKAVLEDSATAEEATSLSDTHRLIKWLRVQSKADVSSSSMHSSKWSKSVECDTI